MRSERLGGWAKSKKDALDQVIGLMAKPELAAMVVKGDVDFDALDGGKVDLIFLIAAPNSEDNVHLDVLSKLSVLLMDENYTNGLRKAKTVEEFLRVIDAAEAEKDAAELGCRMKVETRGSGGAKNG